jgi:hypothetical protein
MMGEFKGVMGVILTHIKEYKQMKGNQPDGKVMTGLNTTIRLGEV